jgi:hypothetical protein
VTTAAAPGDPGTNPERPMSTMTEVRTTVKPETWDAWLFEPVSLAPGWGIGLPPSPAYPVRPAAAPDPVKPGPARPARPRGRFGAGLLGFAPPARVAFTAADDAWHAADAARREEADIERAAAESAAVGRLERGLCC